MINFLWLDREKTILLLRKIFFCLCYMEAWPVFSY
uniref:Uncharacterized protein n=1 Tax=Rhizophora mucronata TaxID=61149 RepID=A0A2P2NH03_RHIMU